MTTTDRIPSIDLLRGITVAGMIVVNNAGGPTSWRALGHSAWNGLTPCDLVFPFFLFIAGVSIYLSLARTGFACNGAVLRKIVRRTLLILCIGWAIEWINELCISGIYPPPSSWRLTGVLPRIALCYGTVAIAAITLPHWFFPSLIAGLLALYALILLSGNGYAADESNLLAVVDRRLLGAGHLYRKSFLDPEGLASTMPAVAHTAIGFCCGKLLTSPRRTSDRRLLLLGSFGFALLAAGYLLSDLLPINKRIWSPTFALTTCGAAALALSSLAALPARWQQGRWSRFFLVFGTNSLLLYALSELIAPLLRTTGIRTAVYEGLFRVVSDPACASALYSVLFMLFLWSIGWVLWRRRCFLRI